MKKLLDKEIYDIPLRVWLKTPFVFLRSIVKFFVFLLFRDRSVFVSRDQQTDRLRVCYRCSMLSSNGQCRVCGCFVSVKTSLASEHCPLYFWD